MVKLVLVKHSLWWDQIVTLVSTSGKKYSKTLVSWAQKNHSISLRNAWCLSYCFKEMEYSTLVISPPFGPGKFCDMWGWQFIQGINYKESIQLLERWTLKMCGDKWGTANKEGQYSSMGLMNSGSRNRLNELFGPKLSKFDYLYLAHLKLKKKYIHI